MQIARFQVHGREIRLDLLRRRVRAELGTELRIDHDPIPQGFLAEPQHFAEAEEEQVIAAVEDVRGEETEGKEEAVVKTSKTTGKVAEEEPDKSEEMAPSSVASVVTKEDKGGGFSK